MLCVCASFCLRCRGGEKNLSCLQVLTVEKIEEDHGNKSMQISMTGARKGVVLVTEGDVVNRTLGSSGRPPRGVVLERTPSRPHLLSLCSHVTALHPRFLVWAALQNHLGNSYNPQCPGCSPD